MTKSLLERVTWRRIYAVCALVYLVWVGFLSQGEIDMVNTRYSRAKERLEPVRIEKIALQELVEECRLEQEQSGMTAGAAAVEPDPCLSRSSAVVKEQVAKVQARLLDEKKKAGRKLILFYVTYAVFFLVLPVVVTYYLLAFIIWMARGTTSAKKEKKRKE